MTAPPSIPIRRSPIASPEPDMPTICSAKMVAAIGEAPIAR
jgi:hypothetical protein